MNEQNVPVTYAKGDGIGPEIMGAVVKILKAAGARIDLTEVTVGEQAYLAGEKNGVSDADLQKIAQSRAFLKAPLNTPQGKGYSSVNVAIRKHFDLFANIRPSQSLEPVISSGGKKADLIVVRENIEDLYAGREIRVTPDTAIGLKASTRSESERIIRSAFEYARAAGRTKVTAIAKDNIQKFTDGVNFHQVFDDVAKDYPDITPEFYIADIGIARTGARPENFDVIVTQNMYGDIISDVIGEALGSIGLSGSANIGPATGMFEAVHGTAPDIAGKGIANPSGLLMAAVMMLNYIGQNDVAQKIHNAWLTTLEDGYFTGEIYAKGWGHETEGRAPANGQPKKKKVGTADFAEALIERLGKWPKTLKPVRYPSGTGGFTLPQVAPQEMQRPAFRMTGMDVDVEWTGDASALAAQAQPLIPAGMKLEEIHTVRGDKVWPEARKTFYTDCMTLRVSFDDAQKGEPEKRALAAKMLDAFSGASSLPWQGTRALTVNAATLEKNFR